jgi:hypothetical protein
MTLNARQDGQSTKEIQQLFDQQDPANNMPNFNEVRLNSAGISRAGATGVNLRGCTMLALKGKPLSSRKSNELLFLH